MEPARKPAVSVSGLLQVVAVLACVFTVTGFLGSAWWLFDLTSHFRVQYLAMLLLVAGAGLAVRQRRLALVCVPFALLNLFAVRSLWLSPDAGFKANGEAPVLRAVLLNVRTENEEKARVLTFLQDTKADVIAILEADKAWADALRPLQASYPRVVAEPREDNFGLMLFSRHPILKSQTLELGGAEIPTIEADLEIAGRGVKLFLTHPLPPGSRENTRLRDEQLRLLSEKTSGLAESDLVLGDLNTSQWGSAFRMFRQISRLQDTSEGRGWQTTWPTVMPALLIPLDHAFASSDLRVVGRHIGPHVGSDHYPLIVELALLPIPSATDRAPAGFGGANP